MDRIALAKRLESLSSVFASHTPYNRDLKAMSYVLNKMADDKFTGILSGDFESEEFDACMCGKGPGPLQGIVPTGIPVDEPLDLPGSDEKPKVIIIKKEGEMPMSVEASEKTAGMFWCKQASKAVVDNLLRDVVGMNKSVCCDTGRHLDKEQIPDGTHKPTLAPTLKKEQAPDIEKSINSGMVEKSHGAVKKEAATGEDIAKAREEKKNKELLKTLEKDQKAKKTKKKEKSASDESEEKIEQIAEKKEEEAEKLVEKAQDDLKKAEEKLEEAKEEEDKAEKAEKEEKDAASSVIEGIELMSSLDEVELDAGEAAKLSRLFS
jgi:hypothetical protein